MTCNNKGFVVTIGTLLSVAYINFSLMNQDNVNRVGSSFSENPKPILPTYHSNHTVWISMGLCYDEHTKILGKKDYPYQEITPLAIRLWKHFRPEVNVYIKLIRNRKTFTAPMKMYEQNLKESGADIVEWSLTSDAGNLSCVLQAQMSRLFLYRRPEVKPSDLVMTVDVNLFVMGSHILEPIDRYPNHRLWIPQYYDTADISYGFGETFNENLMAMSAEDWKMLLNAPDGLTESWVHEKQEEIALDKSQTWYYDQWVTTHGILKNKLCNVPAKSGLWKNKGLKFDPTFNDTGICWHGYGYKDCNRDIHIVPHGCKWWHFYPDENFVAHVKKFNEITKNEYKINLKDIYEQSKDLTKA